MSLSLFDVAGSLWNQRQEKEKRLLTSWVHRCNCLVIIFVLGLSGYFWRANKQADEGRKIIEGSESFRYTL